MGFDWDAYKGGGNYISAAEKKALADSGIPFVVNAVRGPIDKGFEKPAFELDITVPNPEDGETEERCLSFPFGSGAESRDRMLKGMQEHLAGGGEPLEAKVYKAGRGYFLAPVEEAA